MVFLMEEWMIHNLFCTDRMVISKGTEDTYSVSLLDENGEPLNSFQHWSSEYRRKFDDALREYFSMWNIHPTQVVVNGEIYPLPIFWDSSNR